MTPTPSNPVQRGQPKKAEAPHVPAAFINALAEEGTKTEAIWYLQKYWNEACALGARLKEATRLINEGGDTLEKLIKAEARVSELENLGRFLVDRLDEFDPGEDEPEREYHGHVAPALARFRDALTIPSAARGPGDGE